MIATTHAITPHPDLRRPFPATRDLLATKDWFTRYTAQPTLVPARFTRLIAALRAIRRGEAIEHETDEPTHPLQRL
ncbi:hypothetical protein BN2476_500220 [Paraburkholderia piptadeniae]|uniref:Uncharacterized protein n=1 Tax=Paraburkholderia piptadeniae TaxID=1701573 RepID=A0A1N7SGH4_9BURK|nr:hypothetical protein BN2476_500220 [Paraburkholderia piptadeniae]